MTSKQITPDSRAPKRWVLILLGLAVFEIARASQEGYPTWRLVAAGVCVLGALVQVSILWHYVELDDLGISQRIPLTRKRSVRWGTITEVRISEKSVRIKSTDGDMHVTRHVLPGRMNLLALRLFLALRQHNPNASIVGFDPDALRRCGNCRKRIEGAIPQTCPHCGQALDPEIVAFFNSPDQINS